MLGLIEIFYAPAKVFEYVREKRAFVWALLANMILFAGMNYYATNAIGAGNIARQQFENSKFAANMPAEQKEQAIAAAEQPTRKAIVTASVFLVVGIMMLFFALLYMAIAGVSGGPIKFTQALGAVTYSAWPFTVLTVILSIVIIMMAADKSELDPQHLLAFNVGAFLEKNSPTKFLYSFASSIDVLRLAGVAFSAWGLSIVAKISFGKSLTGMLLLWLIASLIGAGAASLFM
jgi:hypothetical protein